VDFSWKKSLDALKKAVDETVATHCFIGKEEYLEDKPYFDELCKRIEVIVIQGRQNSVAVPRPMKCIYKPFYTLSAATVLNNEYLSANLNEGRREIAGFVAPRARILVVDDNALNIKVAVGLMRPYHMQIMTADSARVAISYLRSKDIDLVFMDHMMPEIDGVEATKMIRVMGGDYYKKLPIIALTANAVGGAREMFLQSGFNDFLAKPIELSALDRVLKTWLPESLIEKAAKDTHGKDSGSEKSEPVTYEASEYINPNTGIFYTGGNKEAYFEILAFYVNKGTEKADYIERLFEERSWKNYVIEVHALKSTSLSIGAAKLSELAKKLELAGKAGGIIKPLWITMRRLSTFIAGLSRTENVTWRKMPHPMTVGKLLPPMKTEIPLLRSIRLNWRNISSV